jgi:hypothetical protein
MKAARAAGSTPDCGSPTVRPNILRHQPPIPGINSQSNSDFRKITRNLKKKLAI